MKSNFFFATVAAAVIFTSCADKQMLEPIAPDTTAEFDYEAYQAGFDSEETRSDLEDIRSREHFTALAEVEADAHPFGKFVIAEVFVFENHIETARTMVVENERDLWIQTEDRTWTPNLEYAEEKLNELEAPVYGEGDVREIRVYAYRDEVGGEERISDVNAHNLGVAHNAIPQEVAIKR